MALLRRIGNLFRRSRIDREIDAELRAHIEMRIEDNVAAGMTPENARRESLRDQPANYWRLSVKPVPTSAPSSQ